MKTSAATTRTAAEIKAATDEVYKLMAHQPASRRFVDKPRLNTGGCTAPSCSNRRCTCSQTRSSR
ncbi:hypothetical protein FH608_045905 [Nonomuraea phyllanthi]|uniref:Uncharacterized protein n=1 Tax=Nonomuraea phyllanthi TaxID=2219224 RepID=A0A5C4V5R3_9ACTN|nr:hypothetical protein [Nonomuraea phyllanthi]KAB8186832.1 hypothetical protein FH608_045905 [Nonomuraea phyllanthi]